MTSSTTSRPREPQFARCAVAIYALQRVNTWLERYTVQKTVGGRTKKVHPTNWMEHVADLKTANLITEAQIRDLFLMQHRSVPTGEDLHWFLVTQRDSLNIWLRLFYTHLPKKGG